MQKYAKLTDGKIEFAPQNKGAISNYNLSAELMERDGYKPLIVIEKTTAEKPIIHYRDTKERIEQYAEAKPIEQKASEVRSVRNRYLEQTDKFLIADYPITEEERKQYKAYRVYLRDYTLEDEWWEHSPKDFSTWKEMLTEEEE